MGSTLNMIAVAGGLYPTLEVTIAKGPATSVTATLNSTVVNLTYDSAAGVWRGTLKSFGTWTVEASNGEKTVSGTVDVTSVAVYTAGLSFGPLPVGYTELEYLESTGTQYIDTTVPMSGNTNFDIEISNFDVTSSYSGAFGVDNNNLQPSFGLVVSTSGPEFQANGVIYRFADVTSKQIIGYHSQKLYVNNSHVATGNISGNYPYTMYLFSYHSASSLFGKVRIYSAIFYDTSENEIRHFIPAKRDSDDVLGMYDIVTDTFFTNQGSGSFIAGPEI